MMYSAGERFNHRLCMGFDVHNFRILQKTPGRLARCFDDDLFSYIVFDFTRRSSPGQVNLKAKRKV